MIYFFFFLVSLMIMMIDDYVDALFISILVCLDYMLMPLMYYIYFSDILVGGVDLIKLYEYVYWSCDVLQCFESVLFEFAILVFLDFLGRFCRNLFKIFCAFDFLFFSFL